jgi:hypothetical protein
VESLKILGKVESGGSWTMHLLSMVCINVWSLNINSFDTFHPDSLLTKGWCTEWKEGGSFNLAINHSSFLGNISNIYRLNRKTTCMWNNDKCCQITSTLVAWLDSVTNNKLGVKIQIMIHALVSLWYLSKQSTGMARKLSITIPKYVIYL